MPSETVTTNALWVMSDLHLAPPGDLLAFRAHEPLVALLDFIAAGSGAQQVVLNGDVFDFLQLPGYSAFSLPLAPARLAAILDALAAEPPTRNIVAALQRLTAAGHGLHCLPGNHDPELNLAPVQALLRERLGASQALEPGCGVWRMQAGGRQVIGRHGHDSDPFNRIASAQVLAAQRNGDETVALPPGSKLVLDVINPYRRAQEADGQPRFPFIDLLPSEMAVVLALLYLDPQLAMRRLNAVLGAGSRVLARLVEQRLAPRQSLLGNGGGAADTTPLDGVAAALVDGMDDTERAAPLIMATDLRTYLDHTPSARDGLLAGGQGRIRRMVLRAFCRALAAGHSAVLPSEPDELAKQVLGTWGRNGIVLTGHTHAAKHIVHENGVYLNTGTWQDRLQVPTTLDETSVADWLGRLQRDELPRWRGCPVAHIDADGARLLHWNGTLAPWAPSVNTGMTG